MNPAAPVTRHFMLPLFRSRRSRRSTVAGRAIAEHGTPTRGVADLMSDGPPACQGVRARLRGLLDPGGARGVLVAARRLVPAGPDRSGPVRGDTVRAPARRRIGFVSVDPKRG